MNREEIIRLAREAGLGWDDKYHWFVGSEALERFAKLVAAAEREACAKVCEVEAEKWEGEDGPICAEARMCAVNIRARGKE